jgi:hypothetical protein
VKRGERRAVVAADPPTLRVESWRMRRLMELLVVAQRRKWDDPEAKGMRDEG